MSKKKKSGCGILILILIILVILGGAGIFVYESYEKQKEKIAQEINELPPFDQAQAEQKIADELNLELPVKPPSKTENEIKKLAKNMLKELAQKNVPTSLLALKTRAIIRKYRPVKEGEKVSFLLMTTGKTVNGTFKGTGSDHKGKFIKVDYDKYRLYDIDQDRLYLFDSVISQKRATTEIKALKDDFKEKRINIMKTNKDKILEELYLKSGYRQSGGSWEPNTSVFTAKLEDKEKEHKKTQAKEIDAIYERNKLFGLIDIEPPEEKVDEENNQDDDDKVTEEE